MAQYYQVLSQGDKGPSDGMRKFYHTNVIENQNIQYVITPENQQPLQGQQIVVSTDQLMVIENQNQQVIVDQTGTTFQNAQYIVQEGMTTFAGIRTQAQRQVYYATVNSDHPQTVQVEQQRIQQPSSPIVLNHQLQQKRNQSSNNIQKNIVTTQARTAQVQQNRPTLSLLNTIKTSNMMQNGAEDGRVCLPDGSVMALNNYKVMLTNKRKPINNMTVSSTSLNDDNIDSSRATSYSKGRELSPKSRVVRGGIRGGRARRGNGRLITTNSNFSQQQQDNSAELKAQAHQRFIAQQQQKMVQQQQQQKTNLPQTQFLQHRQQLLQQQQQQTVLRQQQLQQQQMQQQLQVQQAYVQPQYIIQPPSMHQAAQYNLPPYVVSSQIEEIIENTPVSDEFPDSIRMLVLLDSGEQRLITFTLPKEVCTIQEILEQVGVPFQSDTRIVCHETSYPGINYLVTVGLQPDQGVAVQDETTAEGASRPSSFPQSHPTTDTIEVSPSSPELLSEEEAPHFITGLVAICTHCGYSSENLNKCLRCKYKLTNEGKTAPVLPPSVPQGLESLKDRRIAINLKNPDATKIAGAMAIADNIKKKVKSKPDLEPDVFTLSSDEEEEGQNINNVSETDQLLKRFNNSSVTLSAIKKEPTITDLQQSMTSDKQTAVMVRGGGKEDYLDNTVIASIKCRTIRIGSYKYSPKYDVIIKPFEVVLKVPSLREPSDIKIITIETQHVAKVLVNFQKALPVIFYYITPTLGEKIRSELCMEKGSDIYFDPLSSEEAYKRITILPEIVYEEAKVALREIYAKPPNIVMDELTTKEANDILVKTCPKEISKFVEATLNTSNSPAVRQLLIYPPGKGGLPINTEDYMCLGQDQFLNDVIIDFYLKYLVLQLPPEQQLKIHVFSTFFYKRLTTKPVKASRKSHPAELDSNLTPAKRRHARVEKWTKRINLFDKDFIIVPINENAHWYLAIICFPALDGAYTMDGKQIQIEEKHKLHKSLTIGSVTITNIKKEKEKPINCDEDEVSDKDEAEGDESELDSDTEEESDSPEAVQPDISNDTPIPIKQPCILIFDSLPGASRARVVATLRDYLSCEYKAKLGVDKVFSKDVIKGSCPKVPQQTNFTDCGLYLLQYVEHFLSDPIQNYQIPIRHLKGWFSEYVVTKKREDIALLIKELMNKYNVDTSCIPMLTLPTMNGKPVDNFEMDEDEIMNEYEDDEDEEEEMCDEHSSDYLNSSMETNVDVEGHSDIENSFESLPTSVNLSGESLSEITLIPKQNSTKGSGGFLEETVADETELKPDVSELQKQTSRDTLSYLKAKRINRHRNSELADVKKFKTSYE